MAEQGDAVCRKVDRQEGRALGKLKCGQPSQPGEGQRRSQRRHLTRRLSDCHQRRTVRLTGSSISVATSNPASMAAAPTRPCTKVSSAEPLCSLTIGAHVGSRALPTFWVSDAPGAPASNHAPNREHDDCPNDCSNQPCTFAGTIPPKSLAQPCSNECAHDPEDGRENEAGWFVRAGMEELRDQARHEPDDYRPNKSHVTVLPRC